MSIKEIAISQIKESISVKEDILGNNDILNKIVFATEMIIDAYRNGSKTLIAGNGGSAADAQHIAGEFVSKFYFDRPAIASISLSTDTSILTAIGNDYGFDRLFSRQLEALAKAGDIFIGITTSGNSENILKALITSRELGLKTIVLTGLSGGKASEICDVCIKVPSKETPRIQESHILIGHIICCIVEQSLHAKDDAPNFLP